MSVLRTAARLAALAAFAAVAIPDAQANDCDKNHYILPPCMPAAPPVAPVASFVATDVAIGPPGALAVDAAGTVYFSSPNIVFKVDRGGNLTRVAGNGAPGFSGDGGPARTALLSFPRTYPERERDSMDFGELLGALAVDRVGNLYIADAYNNRVRKVSADGVITTVLGNGKRECGSCVEGIPPAEVPIMWPQGVAVADDGTIYAASAYGWLPKINPEGVVSTVTHCNCGDGYLGPGLCGPAGMALDSVGNLLATDGYCRVRKVGSDGTVLTIAGADSRPDGHGSVFTCGLSGDGGPAIDAAMRQLFSVAADRSGNIFIADTENHCIRRVDAAGVMTTFAGVCGFYYETTYRGRTLTHWIRGGFSGDLGPATLAELRRPHGVAVDADGNVYIADTDNLRIRKVTPDGIINTVAGNGEDFPQIPVMPPM